MAWFAVDDGFPDHPKLERLEGRPMDYALAVAAWCLMGADCMKPDRASDGFVTHARLKKVLRLPRSLRERAVSALVECELWEPVEGGYKFHDWTDYQPTADEILADKKARAERQKRYRQKQKQLRLSLSVDASRDGSPNASRDAASNAPHSASRDANVTHSVDGALVRARVSPSPSPSPKHTACAPESAHTATPAAPPESELAEAVRERLEAGLRAHGASVPTWTPTNLAHVAAICAWLVQNHGGEPLAALERVLAGWFADAWTGRQGFPLGDLANRTGKYFAGVVEPPRALADEAWEALQAGDVAKYRALMARAREAEESSRAAG